MTERFEVEMPEVFPSTMPLMLVEVDGADAVERGRQRGRAVPEQIARAAEAYRALFAAKGMDVARRAAAADAALDAIHTHVPHLLRELEGIAEASGVALVDLALLNSRTEVLGAATPVVASECSTIAAVDGVVASAQTWDWHVEMQDGWHVQRVRGGRHGFVGMTEFGVLAKAGMNDAGVGLHLNILGHRRDGIGGVPVHLICHEVLSNAGSVSEAIDIVRGFPLSSSSTLTVVDETTARVLELSPDGVEVIAPQNGVLLHTNHFLAARPAAAEKPHPDASDSLDRLALLASRVAVHAPVPDVADLVTYLCSSGDEAQLTVFPDAAPPFGERWATLATIGLEPAGRTLRITRNPPTLVDPAHWIVLVAG